MFLGIAVTDGPAQTLSEPPGGAGLPSLVTGVVTSVYVDDFARGSAELVQTIRDARTGRSFRLRFERAPAPSLRSGAVVTIAGRMQGSNLYVLADQTASSSTATVGGGTAGAPATTPVTGDQRTLVMVANFQDASVSCSTAAINDAVFTDPLGLSVNALYSDNSHGRVSFSGPVVGPYTLPYASTDPCAIGIWADAADAQAAASGIDVTAFARKVYVMPPNSCGSAGLGTVGGAPSRAWVFSCDLKGVFAHELGHNLGMDHASTATEEYGDTTDPMSFGSTRLRGLNAPHRQALGWLGAAGTQVVSETGTYDIAPLALDSTLATAPYTIAIAKPDTREYYYLSYRLASGFDNYIDGSYVGKLSIHRYAGDGSTSRTFLLAGLGDGQSFTDPVNGITITLVSHDSTRASTRIAFTTACSAATPSISLAPAAQSGSAGSSLAYAVSLANMDGPACGATTFALSSVVPSGWTAGLSPTTLSLAPGTSGQATLVLTSSTAATAGTYAAIVRAGDGATAAHDTSASASYTVTVPCTPAAPALAAAPASQGGVAGTTLSYSISIANRDEGTCTPSTWSLQPALPAGWSGSVVPASVTLGAGETATATLTVTSASAAAAATYTVAARVSDPIQPIHAASVAVQDVVQPPPDTTAPTAPALLTASVSQRQKRIRLSWGAASDNVGVAGYRVWRNGVAVATSTTTSWIEPSWVAGATYTYTVTAYDAAGNASAPSNSVTVRTKK